MRRARASPTRPNKLCSNKVLYVERWKALGNLLRRLALVADELEHGTIGIFHAPTVLLVVGGVPARSSRRSLLRRSQRADNAGRGDVRPLAVTNVLTAMLFTDETKPGPSCAARPYVAGEIVAQLVDLDVE